MTQEHPKKCQEEIYPKYSSWRSLVNIFCCFKSKVLFESSYGFSWDFSHWPSISFIFLETTRYCCLLSKRWTSLLMIIWSLRKKCGEWSGDDSPPPADVIILALLMFKSISQICSSHVFGPLPMMILSFDPLSLHANVMEWLRVRDFSSCATSWINVCTSAVHSAEVSIEECYFCSSFWWCGGK